MCSFFPKKNLLREIQALFSNLHRWREDTNHQRLVYLQGKSSKISFTSVLEFDNKSCWLGVIYDTPRQFSQVLKENNREVFLRQK